MCACRCTCEYLMMQTWKSVFNNAKLACCICLIFTNYFFKATVLLGSEIAEFTFFFFFLNCHWICFWIHNFRIYLKNSKRWKCVHRETVSASRQDGKRNKKNELGTGLNVAVLSQDDKFIKITTRFDYLVNQKSLFLLIKPPNLGQD